jgi:hypothetical protein
MIYEELMQKHAELEDYILVLKEDIIEIEYEIEVSTLKRTLIEKYTSCLDTYCAYIGIEIDSNKEIPEDLLHPKKVEMKEQLRALLTNIIKSYQIPPFPSQQISQMYSEYIWSQSNIPPYAEDNCELLNQQKEKEVLQKEENKENLKKQKLLLEEKLKSLETELNIAVQKSETSLGMKINKLEELEPE